MKTICSRIDTEYLECIEITIKHDGDGDGGHNSGDGGGDKQKVVHFDIVNTCTHWHKQNMLSQAKQIE